MSVEYKYKPDKHTHRVNIKTIDEIHHEHLSGFKKSRDSVPNKKKQLENLENELNDLETLNEGRPINLDIDLLRKRNKIRRSIESLKKEISDIENYSAEMSYYGKAGDIIYDYYDLTNGMLYGQNYDRALNMNNIDAMFEDCQTQKVVAPTQKVVAPTQKVVAPTQKVVAPNQNQRVTSKELTDATYNTNINTNSDKTSNTNTSLDLTEIKS